MGLPANIMVDGGSEFQGQFAQMVKMFFNINIKVSRNSARFVERVNFTLRRAIDDRMKALRLHWHRVIQPVVEQYNETPHISSKYSPDFLSKNEEWLGFMKTVHERYMEKRKLQNPRTPIPAGSQVKLRQKPGRFSDYKRDFKHYGRQVYVVEGEVRVGTQRMYKVRGLSNPVLPSDLMKILGAEGAPEEMIEEQRRRYNPEEAGEVESEEEASPPIEAPEGFGDMYADALREFFFWFQVLHQCVVRGQWRPNDLEILGLTQDEAGEREVVHAIRVRSKFRSGIIKRFLRADRPVVSQIRWRGGVLKPDVEEPKARIARPVWRSGVLSSA
jgi:hypothetical protein